MFYQEIENGSLPTLKYITATIEKKANWNVSNYTLSTAILTFTKNSGSTVLLENYLIFIKNDRYLIDAFLLALCLELLPPFFIDIVNFKKTFWTDFFFTINPSSEYVKLRNIFKIPKTNSTYTELNCKLKHAEKNILHNIIKSRNLKLLKHFPINIDIVNHEISKYL